MLRKSCDGCGFILMLSEQEILSEEINSKYSLADKVLYNNKNMRKIKVKSNIVINFIIHSNISKIYSNIRIEKAILMSYYKKKTKFLYLMYKNQRRI